MSFPRSNFLGNVSTYVFDKCVWHFRERKLVVGNHHIYYAKKILNTFVCVEVRILLENEIYMKLNFSDAISRNILIGNDFFVFKYPFTCKQIISKFSLLLLKLM